MIARDLLALMLFCCEEELFINECNFWILFFKEVSPIPDVKLVNPDNYTYRHHLGKPFDQSIIPFSK